MTKIEQIQQAIQMADSLQSKMSQQAWDVPALASLRGRHLLNNLGAISTKYLECGLHKGGTFTSAICNNANLLTATGIDNFASDEAYQSEKAEPECMVNVGKVLHAGTNFYFHKTDCFSADLSLIEKNNDFYFYDASHSREDQRNALLYYKPVLADEFIYMCDDWDFGEVKDGTMEGIEEGEYDVLFQQELHGAIPGEHDNMSWWRGYGVFLLKKK